MTVHSLSRAMTLPAVVLGVVTLTLVMSAGAGLPVAGAAALHFASLLAYGLLAFLALRIPYEAARTAAAGALAIASMFLLYNTLGHVAFDAIPWNGDAALRAADRALALGAEPTVLLSNAISGSRVTVEALAFFYAAFIPYLYLSIFLTLVGRPPVLQIEFITAFTLLYGMSFLGYLFVPARGPVVAMAGDFASALNGGPFLQLVVDSIDRMGGPHGAFPSLHLGASLLLCVFDLRRGDPLRGLVYIPLVALIAIATVSLRYHYVIDLLAGAAFALLALAVAARLTGVRRGA